MTVINFNQMVMSQAQTARLKDWVIILSKRPLVMSEFGSIQELERALKKIIIDKGGKTGELSRHSPSVSAQIVNVAQELGIW